MSPAEGQWRGDLKARIYATQTTALRVVAKKLISLYRDIGRSIDERQLTEGWGKGVVGGRCLKTRGPSLARKAATRNVTSGTSSLLTFFGSQYRLPVDNYDYFSDLLLYHRTLKSTTLPIGTATCGLTSCLPEAYRNLLPSEDEIVARLAGWTEE